MMGVPVWVKVTQDTSGSVVIDSLWGLDAEASGS